MEHGYWSWPHFSLAPPALAKQQKPAPLPADIVAAWEKAGTVPDGWTCTAMGFSAASKTKGETGKFRLFGCEAMS